MYEARQKHIWKLGDPCKKCGTPVALKTEYPEGNFYLRCFICPNDHTIFFVPNESLSKKKTLKTIFNDRPEVQELREMIMGVLRHQNLVADKKDVKKILAQVMNEWDKL